MVHRGIPTNPPIIVDPTDPPIDGGIPTLPPQGGSIPTLPYMGVITNPPVHIVGVICLQGKTCAMVGDICSEGTQDV